MKRLAFALVILAATTGAALAAASPFTGTWKLDVAKSKFTGDTFTYTKTATGFHYSNGSTVEYNFTIDGKDHPTIFDRTSAWTKAGNNGWDTVVKANGKVINKSHRALSADGKTLTIAFTAYRPDGTTSTETDVYTRVSGGPGLAGKWKDVKTQAASDTLTIATPTPGSFAIDYPNYKQTIAGPTNGTPVPVKGPTVPAGVMASYKSVGPAKWQYSTTVKQKVYNQGVMTVSADGKTLTDTSWVPGKESEKSVAVYDKQ